MSDEPNALSPISRPSLASETEYEAICQAVMETERGRWFLSEYARRSRQGDTKVLLAAISRIEMRLRGEQEPQSLDRLVDALTEMARVLARMKGDITAIRPADGQHDPFEGQGAALDAITAVGERTTADIAAATERIQELAWSMREQGLDPALCDQLDASAAEIHGACALQDVAGQRTGKVIDTLRTIEERIGALGDLWDAVASGPPPEAAAPPPDAEPGPEAGEAEAAGAAAFVDGQVAAPPEPVGDGEETAAAEASAQVAADVEAAQAGSEKPPEAEAMEPPFAHPDAELSRAEPVAAEGEPPADHAAVEAELASESLFFTPDAADVEPPPEPLGFTPEAPAEAAGEPPGPFLEGGVPDELEAAALTGEAPSPDATSELGPDLQPEHVPDADGPEPERAAELAAPTLAAEWVQPDDPLRESVEAVVEDFLAATGATATEPALLAGDDGAADIGLILTAAVVEGQLPASSERDALGDALSQALEQMAAEHEARPEPVNEAPAPGEAAIAAEQQGVHAQQEPSVAGEGEAFAAMAVASEPAPPAEAIAFENEPQAAPELHDSAAESEAEPAAAPQPDPWDLPGWLSDPEPAEEAREERAEGVEEPAELPALAAMATALTPDPAPIAEPAPAVAPEAEEAAEAAVRMEEAAPQAESPAAPAEEPEPAARTTRISVVTLIEPPTVILAAPVWVEPDVGPPMPAAAAALEPPREEPAPEPPSASYDAPDRRPPPEQARERTAPPDHDLADFLFEPEPVVRSWSSMAPLAAPRLDTPAAPAGSEAAQPGWPPQAPHLPANAFVRAEMGPAPATRERPEDPQPAALALEPAPAQLAPEPAPEPEASTSVAPEGLALEPTPADLVPEPVPESEAPTVAAAEGFALEPTAAEPIPEPEAASAAADVPEPVVTAVAAAPIMTSVAPEPAPLQEAAAPAMADTPQNDAWPRARSTTDDPLAAIVGLTDEERIALFG